MVSAALTAWLATRAASVAFLAISRMLAPISSTPVATVCTFLLTCSDAADTTLAWAAVSSALALICVLTAVNSSADEPSVVALASTWSMNLRHLFGLQLFAFSILFDVPFHLELLRDDFPSDHRAQVLLVFVIDGAYQQVERLGTDLNVRAVGQILGSPSMRR